MSEYQYCEFQTFDRPLEAKVAGVGSSGFSHGLARALR